MEQTNLFEGANFADTFVIHVNSNGSERDIIGVLISNMKDFVHIETRPQDGISFCKYFTKGGYGINDRKSTIKRTRILYDGIKVISKYKNKQEINEEELDEMAERYCDDAWGCFDRDAAISMAKGYYKAGYRKAKGE